MGVPGDSIPQSGLNRVTAGSKSGAICVAFRPQHLSQCRSPGQSGGSAGGRIDHAWAVQGPAAVAAGVRSAQRCSRASGGSGGKHVGPREMSVSVAGRAHRTGFFRRMLLVRAVGCPRTPTPTGRLTCADPVNTGSCAGVTSL